MFTHILVPLDGSKLAESVLPSAAAVARAYGAKLELVCATDPGSLPHSQDHQAAVSQALEKAQADFDRYLQGVIGPLRDQGLTVTDTVVAGKAAEALASHATKTGADLIAMATHGHSGLGRWMMGSVTDRVLHLTTLPMLIIHPNDQTPAAVSNLTTLVVPLDGSPLAEAVLPYAQELAQRLGLRLVLLQAVQLNMGIMGDADSAYLSADLLTEMKTQAEEYLRGVAGRIGVDGLPCETHVLVGPAASVIVDYAQSEPASMVALASHGRSGVVRAVLGSVADRLVRSSGKSVFVVRPEPAQG